MARIADAAVLLDAKSLGALDRLAADRPAAQVANFFGGDPANREGVRLAVKDLDGDARADVITGLRTGTGSQVLGYSGKVLTGDSPNPTADLTLDAFPDVNAGVFVG